MKKTKIRKQLLKFFIVMQFISYVVIAIAINFAVRFFAAEGELSLRARQSLYLETTGFFGRFGIISVVLIGIMFLIASFVTYCLANSLTRPIEKLSKFAQNIGEGDFSQNDFEFSETELEELNSALNKSARQLAAYDSEQKVFFQNASHELRTPLMSIKCYAEGISFGIMEPVPASETILKETDKLSDLVTDLLYISKIDNISTAYTSKDVDLIELIKSSTIRQEALGAKEMINFSFDFGEDCLYYKCINELFSRAIDNLLSNAIRYAKSQIILSCHKHADYIEISISDDGDGISDDVIEHIFERFYKGADGVHGIGLSIVKSIIEEQHKGRITARNSSNGGAEFSITLPV